MVVWLSSLVTKVLKSLPPTSGDASYSLSKIWIDQAADRAYILLNVTAGVATWREVGGAGPFYASQGEVTIASGIVTVTGPGLWTIDTQSDDATDELDRINGLVAGEVVLLQPADNARVTTVTQGAFMDLQFDFPLDNVAAKFGLISAGSDVCEELSRASNT